MKPRTLYKLTDENMKTYGGFSWELNKTYSTDGAGALCGPGWLHAYSDPLLAVLLNPIHARFAAPRLFRARGSGRYKDDHGLKCGVTKLRLLKELPLPAITTVQRVAFGILCAKAVCKDKAWSAWADGWLSGRDRSAPAAYAAATAAYAAANAAYAAAAAANAAYAAANAAYAAANAAYAAAAAANAAYAAATAAYAAANAAYAAATAANAAYAADVAPINFKKLAKEAMKF